MNDVDLESLEQQISNGPRVTSVVTTAGGSGQPRNVSVSASERIAATIVTPEEVGRLSAEAMQAQVDDAAKAMEEMGRFVIDIIAQHHAKIEECRASLKLLKEAADQVRKKGERDRALIEHTSALTKDIRETCEAITKKVNGDDKG